MRVRPNRLHRARDCGGRGRGDTARKPARRSMIAEFRHTSREILPRRAVGSLQRRTRIRKIPARTIFAPSVRCTRAAGRRRDPMSWPALRWRPVRMAVIRWARRWNVCKAPIGSHSNSIAGARGVPRTSASDSAANPSVQSATFEVRTDAAVLRRKVSVPLDRLVQPVSLAEIAAVSEVKMESIAEPASIGSPDNPFADDSRPEPNGTIQSGKLLGIIGPRWPGPLPYLLTRYVNTHRNCRLLRRRALCQPRRTTRVQTRHSHLPKTTHSRNLPRTQAVREVATAPSHPRKNIRSNSDATFNLCLW